MARIVDDAEHELNVLRGLVDVAGKDVLDIGCGEGRTAWRLARTAASVLGIDPDAERIARARGAAVRGGACEPRFLAENVVALDLPGAEFDVAIFTRSL